jgi:DNA-binding response OmpR family regulator
MPPAAQLLVVSPDPSLLRLAKRCAASLGHDALVSTGAFRAERLLAREEIDLVCLDSVLTPADTRRVLRSVLLRENGCKPRVLFFGAPARGSLGAGLDVASDAYVSRPPERIELTRWLTRLLAEPAETSTGRQRVEVGRVALDVTRQALYFSDGAAIMLTPTECRLLRYLMERPGDFVSTPDLLEHVWGYPPDSAPELVRQHVSNIRRKLRNLGEDAGLVQTAPYYGYGFVGGRSSAS